MKNLLLIPAVLFSISVLSTSCHPRYACSCQVKDSLSKRVIYGPTTNWEAVADSDCITIQSQHTGDTCMVITLAD